MPPEPAASAWRAPWVALALVVAVAATFANALQNEFVFDDHLLIVDDPAVRVPLDQGLGTGSYRPLRTLSYRIDYAIGGMDPRVFHLSNVVYHALTVLLVCAGLRGAGASLAAAAAGALVFAVHPVQTDAVTYASGRRDVLCGLFFVAGFVAYLRYRRRGGVLGLLVVGGAYALAILAKEMAVTLPLVCLVFERWSARRAAAGEDRRDEGGTAPVAQRELPRVLPWFLATTALGAAVLAVVYGGSLRRVLRATSWHGGSIGANFATVARIWTHYLVLLVWPARLSADYSYDAFPVSKSLVDPRAIVSAAVLVALGLAAWRSWRRGGLVGLGAAWWAVTLLPVSHVVPYTELLAEHYLYIPMVGAALVVAGVVDALAARAPARRRVLATAVLAVVAALAVRTVIRNRDWQDPLSLWSATVAAVPACARAHFNLGQAYFGRGRLEEAGQSWLEAERIKPDDPAVSAALATLHYRLGEQVRARELVEKALRLRPGEPELETLAGWIALDSGDPVRAREHFDAALAKLPPDRNEGARVGKAHAEQRLGPSRQQIIPLGRKAPGS